MTQGVIYLRPSYGSAASREPRRLVAIGAPAFFRNSGRRHSWGVTEVLACHGRPSTPCRSDTWPGLAAGVHADQLISGMPVTILFQGSVTGIVRSYFSADATPLLCLGLRMQRRAVAWLILTYQPKLTLARQSSTNLPPREGVLILNHQHLRLHIFLFNTDHFGLF